MSIILNSSFSDIPGSDLDREHCQVTWEGHRVMLHPLSEKCYVNHRRVDEAVELCQGGRVCCGGGDVGGGSTSW